MIRPEQIDRAVLQDVEQYNFYAGERRLQEYMRGKRTDRWGNSNVHCCCVSTDGLFYWHDWTCYRRGSEVHGFQPCIPVGLLLDLDEGTLSNYQRGHKLVTLKDGLSGEYCWYTTTYSVGATISTISIERGLAPDE